MLKYKMVDFTLTTTFCSFVNQKSKRKNLRLWKLIYYREHILNIFLKQKSHIYVS